MICPICGHENIPGSDDCEECGADLRGADLPDVSGILEDRLMGDQLEHVRTREPLFVSRDTPLRVAVRLMQEERASCLLVGEGRRLDGILTEGNLLQRAAGRPLDGVRVGAVMTADPVVLRGEDSVAVAIHKMAVGGFRHVPLVEDGRVTGIVTAADLFRHILGILDARRDRGGPG
jgi:CBS domain-containing protein